MSTVDVRLYRVLMVTVQAEADGTYEARALINGRQVATSSGWTTRGAAFADGALAVVAADDEAK